MVGEHLDLVHAERAAPALLRKRQVHADGENIDAGKVGDLFVELLGLRIADGRVERRNDADDADLVAGVLQGHGLQPVVDHVEIGGRVAGLQFRPDKVRGLPLRVVAPGLSI